MSEMQMSPADMAVCCGGGNYGNNSWNNPMWLLWALLFGGGNGFGWGRNGQGVQDAEIQAKLNSLSSQIQDNQNTNTLGGGIGNVSDQLHSMNNGMNLGFAGVNSNMNNASMNNLMGQKDLQSAIQSCCCNNQTAILNQTNQLQSAIENARQATVNGFANMGYIISQQTNELNTNATANTQRILDKMCNDTTQALRDRVFEMSQKAQTAEIINSVSKTA